MPRLSIIIPSLGNTAGWENSLASVLQNRPEDCELIAVTHGPYNDPYGLVGEVRFVEAQINQGWTERVNQGIAASRGAILNVLSPGIEVSESWADAAIGHFANPRVAMVSPVITLPRSVDRVHCAGVRLGFGGGRQLTSNDAKVVGPSAFAGFYRACAIAAAGGFSSDVGDERADLDLALALQQAEWKAIVEPRSRVMQTSVAKTRRSSFHGGMHAERLFWRHSGSVSLASKLAHPLAAAADVIGALTPWGIVAQLTGRTLACCQFGHYAAHRQKLDEIPAPLSVIVGSASRFNHVRIDGPHAANPASSPAKAQRAA